MRALRQGDGDHRRGPTREAMQVAETIRRGDRGVPHQARPPRRAKRIVVVGLTAHRLMRQVAQGNTVQ